VADRVADFLAKGKGPGDSYFFDMAGHFHGIIPSLAEEM
jgi:hypothetical protein